MQPQKPAGDLETWTVWPPRFPLSQRSLGSCSTILALRLPMWGRGVTCLSYWLRHLHPRLILAPFYLDFCFHLVSLLFPFSLTLSALSRHLPRAQSGIGLRKTPPGQSGKGCGHNCVFLQPKPLVAKLESQFWMKERAPPPPASFLL